MRPFRFGVQPHVPSDAGAWLAHARRIEQLGYDTMLLADHLGGDSLAPLPALVAAAGVTSRLRLGTLVLNNDLRHPAVLARDLASLDILSDGRLEVGIGAGWARHEYEEIGLPYDEPLRRIARLDESLQILDALLRGEEVDVRGDEYRVVGLAALPRPIQLPRPPFMVGGGGKRLVQLAARRAEIVDVHLRQRRDGSGVDWSSGTPEAVEARLRWIREAAGERFDELELSMMVMTFALTDDRVATARASSDRIGETVEEVLASPFRLIGSLEAAVETLERRREQLGISYFIVPGSWVEEFAPVVERLRGR